MQVDPIARKQQLMHGSAQRGIRIGRHLDTPIVGADHSHFLVGKELRGSSADPRTRLDIFWIVFHPKRSPAGMNQHNVTRSDFDVLALKSASQVRGRNFVARLQLRNILVSSHIEQHAASNQRTDVLDPELCQPLGLRKLQPVVSVVEEITDSEMPKAVELRTNLAKFTAHQLVMIDRLVRARDLESLWNSQ